MARRMATILMVGGFAVVPTAAQADTPECDSILAVQIAVADSKTNCTTALTATDNARLTNLTASVTYCKDQGKDANECAEYFYDNPEQGLKPNTNSNPYKVRFLPTSDTTKCADGSKPYYYYHKGGTTASNNWIIRQHGTSGQCRLEGGGNRLL